MNRITGTPGYRYRPSCAVRKKREPAIEYTDFLVHHGIKGQQWGIRRYQNEDGTLTEEGKQRYNDSSPESKKWDKRETAYLTDDELNRRNLRLQREQQYKNLTTSDNERSREQFKNDFKKALLKAAIITPVVAIVGIAAKKHLGASVDLIKKLGKHSIARLRTGLKLKNVTKNAIGKHSHEVIGRPMWGNTIHRDAYTHNPWGSRLYNYRPRTNNALPKTRPWPRV